LIQAAVSLGEVVPEERCSFFYLSVCLFSSVDETNSSEKVFEVRVTSYFSPAPGHALSQLEHHR
jgi:hypothetical protein